MFHNRTKFDIFIILSNDFVCIKVKSKIDMLDNLLEIEVAYTLLSESDTKDGKDPIDAHYDKLNTQITVLEKDNDEFKVIISVLFIY